MRDGEVTIGVSISVPPPYDETLREWRRRSGDPQADRVSPHITLVPPTVVAATALDGIVAELSERCAGLAAFPLRLRGTGTFRPISDVVFVAVAEGISSCEVLSDRLRIDALHTPRSFPYHPHVTVAQDVPSERLDEVFTALDDYRADFIVDEVCAHRLNSDGTWGSLASFALAEGNQGAT